MRVDPIQNNMCTYRLQPYHIILLYCTLKCLEICYWYFFYTCCICMRTLMFEKRYKHYAYNSESSFYQNHISKFRTPWFIIPFKFIIGYNTKLSCAWTTRPNLYIYSLALALVLHFTSFFIRIYSPAKLSSGCSWFIWTCKIILL